MVILSIFTLPTKKKKLLPVHNVIKKVIPLFSSSLKVFTDILPCWGLYHDTLVRDNHTKKYLRSNNSLVRYVTENNDGLLTQQIIMFCCFVRWRADRSLARSRRKPATATKFGIYSTYSPRSSIHFVARCSNFCKQLKKNSDSCPPNQVSAVTITSTSDKKWRPFNCFFSPGNRW